MNKHTLTVLALVGLVVALALLSGSAGPSATEAQTGSITLSGYAWSSNIGWISFRGGGGNGTYGIDINKTTGYFQGLNGVQSGYAWSSNIGWIKFDKDLVGPSGTGHGAKIDINASGGIDNGEEVTGWARACSAIKVTDPNDPCPDSGAIATNTGGWDGWISLSGDTADGGHYGVKKITTGQTERLDSFAWGSEVIGWTNMNPNVTGGGVIVDGLSLSCTATEKERPDNDNVTVTWRAIVSGGSAPYTYCWGNLCSPPLTGSDVNSADLSTNEIEETYAFDVNGQVQKSGQSQATDSTGKKAICDAQTITISQTPICGPGTHLDPISGQCVSDPCVPDPITGICPGGLEVESGHEVVEIRNQASGQPANSVVQGIQPRVRFAKINNTGDDPITGIKIWSIKDKNGTEFLDIGSPVSATNDTPKCALQDNESLIPTNFFDCSDISVSIPGHQSRYFRIQIQRPLQVIAANDHNPYTIVIGDNGFGANATSVKVILDYLVSTFEPI
ncbi:MAG: hypothetical protein HYT48_00580 [Candidatus Vogelbacteria bacterium]|nr:hypothetical protein [Candidatus Vogelbacteria bacterium]